MRMRKRVGVTVLFLAVIAATVVVLSPGEATNSNALAVGTPDVSAPGTAAMRAYVDPETGQLTTGTGLEPAVSVIELNPELENALRQDTEGLVAEYHADGSVSLDLQGRFESASIARIGKDGKVVICTDNVADAERSLNEQTSSTGAREVK